LRQSKYTTEKQIEDMRAEIRREKQKAAGEGGARARHISWKQALKVFEWAVFLFLFIFLVVTLFDIYAAKARGETPAILGVYQLYSVESGSMEPTLTVGSVIICTKTQHPESLKEGQIVTFRTSSGIIVTHRIVEVIRDEGGDVSYRTKGDNPVNSPDRELLTPDRVTGVFAFKIPFT
jgi:signal peptidase